MFIASKKNFLFTFEHDKYAVDWNDIWIEAKGVEKNYLNMIISTLALADLGGRAPLSFSCSFRQILCQIIG